MTTCTDDILITGTHDKKIAEFRAAADARFGTLSWDDSIESFLGINCRHDRTKGIFTFDIAAKINALLKELGLDLKGTDVPYHPDLTSGKISESTLKQLRPILDKIKPKFSSILGSCIYMSISCRPDITTICHKACMGMHDPQDQHLVQAYCLLRYLQRTKDHALTYYSKDARPPVKESFDVLASYPEVGDLSDDPVVIFSDASFADSSDPKLRSTSGYAIYVFGNLVSWKSSRQTLTSKSSMHSELIAAASSSDEGTFYYQLIDSFRLPFGLQSKPRPIPIFCDNVAALTIANHPTTTPASRHLHLRELRIRDYQQAKHVRLYWTPSNLNAADHFTKILTREPFLRGKRILGMTGSDLHYSIQNTGPENLPPYAKAPDIFYLDDFHNIHLHFE